MTKDKLTAINVSFYRNMKSADAKPATIGQVLTAIRSSFYESQVTTIRQLKSQGKQDEADEKTDYAVPRQAKIVDKWKGWLNDLMKDVTE